MTLCVFYCISVECTDSSNSTTVPAGTYCSENDQACCIAHGGRIRSASSEPKRIRKAQIFSERKRFLNLRFLNLRFLKCFEV